MTRRDFSKDASLAFLSGVTVTLAACGGGGYSNPAGGTPPTTQPPAAGSSDEVGDVSANHGHQAVIKAAEILAGATISINIVGVAGHPHMVTLPEAALRDIKEGKPVLVQSTSTDGHEHTVTFNSEIPSPPTRY